LAEQGEQVPRNALAYVVRGAQLGGAPLNIKPSPDASAIARAFLSSLLERAELNGLELPDDVEEELGQWLGLTSETSNT
jgi:hypothetical protein